MTNESLTCYPIHERAYTDRIKFVLVFSHDRGVESIAVSNKSRINFFCPYQAIEKGRRLALQSPTEHPALLQGKILFCGMYLNELIYRFCKPSDPHPEIFNQYKISLQQLRTHNNLELTLRVFELCLLKACGYGIDTFHIQAPYVVFEKDQGFLGTHKPSDQSVPLSILNQMIHELKPSPEVKRFLRHVLNTLLPSILQSRKLYEKITLA
jgi:hypothetical protein